MLGAVSAKTAQDVSATLLEMFARTELHLLREHRPGNGLEDWFDHPQVARLQPGGIQASATGEPA